MKLDGKKLSAIVYEDLERRVRKLKLKGIIPHLAVVLVGNDPASEAYVHQKKKNGEQIGCLVSVHVYPESVSQRELIIRIKELNRKKDVHGIIVQRPLPNHLDELEVDEATDPEKDVDGFLEESPFKEPIALAVDKLLKEALKEIAAKPQHIDQISLNLGQYASIDHYIQAEYKAWIQQKKVVVLGKGKTGGTPIINYLTSLNVKPEIIDSKTLHPESITKDADIIISTVGKPHMIKKDMIKKGVILIAIGMHRGNDGTLQGDYDEEEIADVAECYTPVPGGVGPVNVAMLLTNLVIAAEKE